MFSMRVILYETTLFLRSCEWYGRFIISWTDYNIVFKFIQSPLCPYIRPFIVPSTHAAIIALWQGRIPLTKENSVQFIEHYLTIWIISCIEGLHTFVRTYVSISIE
jgi:hypothetical protein